ncbi:unnamed protein product [Mucor hiemalis]
MSLISNAIGKQELRVKVFNLIMERMNTLCLNTQDLTVERVNFLHPNFHPLSTEHTSITMGCNFNVSDQELVSVLDLTEVTDKNESTLDHSGYRCYIKSFTIKYEIMHNLASTWQNMGLYTSIVNVWFKHLQEHPGRDFHYRYIGQRVSSFTKRHISFTTSRVHGFVKRFFDSLKLITGREECLENYRYFYVNPFSPSTSGYNICDFKALDEHEQILISFFGIDNLLNVQTGGSLASYDPGHENFTNYLQLPTKPNFFQIYRALNRVNVTDVQGAFAEWISLVAQAGRDPVNSTPTLSDSQLEFIYNQAMPKHVDNSGNTVLACISDTVPLTTFKQNHHFLTPGYKNTGTVFCDHLARLEAWQEGQVSFGTKSYSDIFPFLNITPWLTEGEVTEALQAGAYQFNSYMRITLPLITVSISNSATKFCFSEFIHPYGLTPHKCFISDVVGIPRRVFIKDITLIQDKNVKEMPQQNSTIVIPHLHPGLDSHTARDSTGVRSIMDLTWQITLLIAQIAITCSTQNFFLSREHLINTIADKVLPSSPQLDQTMRILYARLNQAKSEYQMSEQGRNAEDHRIVPRESVSASKIQRIKEGRMERFGQAKGSPYSDARREQADILWKTNLPNLHLHIGRDHKDKWYEWIMGIKENKCLAACVWYEMSVIDKPSRNYATLKRFRPDDESGEQDDWMNDPLKVAEANKRWHESIAPSVPENHFSSAAQSKRRREYLGVTYSAIVEGSIQSVQKQGYFMIFWKSPTEGEIKFKIFLNFLIHDLDGRQVRCVINFVPEGIKVTKEDGDQGIFDISHIKSHPKGIQLLQLWGMERERITGQFPQEAIPQTSYLAPGRPMIKVYNDNAREKFSVIQENDSIVILKAYLDTFYPHGGILCFMQPEHYPSLRKHITPYQFDTFIDSYYEFLNTTALKTHPLNTEHVSWLQNPKYIRYFMENIKLLRPGTESMTERVKLVNPKGKIMRAMMLSFK